MYHELSIVLHINYLFTLLKVFLQWFGEPRAFKGDSAGRRTVIYVENCAGHNDSPELRDALLKINTELRYFLPCATDLVQPADSFVFSKI